MAKGISALETMPVSPYARLTRAILAVLAGAILVFLYLPIVFLILFSFEKSDTSGLPDHRPDASTGTRRCSRTARIHTALFNSVDVAVVVAFLATVIGTMAAFALVRGRHPLRRHRPARCSPCRS